MDLITSSLVNSLLLRIDGRIANFEHPISEHFRMAEAHIFATTHAQGKQNSPSSLPDLDHENGVQELVSQRSQDPERWLSHMR